MCYTEILEVNLFAVAYRLFHEDFSALNGELNIIQPFTSFIYINSVGVLIINLYVITSLAKEVMFLVALVCLFVWVFWGR